MRETMREPMREPKLKRVAELPFSNAPLCAHDRSTHITKSATGSHADGPICGSVSVYRRWIPVSGVLAASALALTGLISPPPPIVGAPAAEIASYYGLHRVGLEIESLADGIGVMLLVVFAASLHARIASTPSLTAFAAAAIVAACTLGQVAAFLTLAFRPNPEPARAGLLNDLQSFAFQVTTFPTLLFLGAASVAILGSAALPRWLGLAAAAGAAMQTVAWISFFAPSGVLAAGALPDIVAFAALLAWLAVASVTVLVTSESGRG
jgi:hypothetical protein